VNEPTFFRQLRVVLVLVMILIVIGALGYMWLEGWGLHDALFMTVITLSTVGYGEVRPLTQAGEVFTMLLIFGGVGVLAYSFSTVTDYIVAGELQGYLRRRRTARKMARMQDHYVVCGYGRVGRQVVEELHANEIRLVVVDIDRTLGTELEQLGIPFIVGDPTDDDVLELAGIKRAAGLCSCLPNDATNVFVVLSARQTNAGLLILSRCNQPENQEKVRIAGADKVINPYVTTGRQMATQLLYPSVMEFLDVVIRRGDLELRLQEIVVGPNSGLAGRSLAEANVRTETGVNVLAVRRNKRTLDTNPGGDFIIERGDELVCLGTPEQLSSMARLADDGRRRLQLAS
jgi:voltage-gated potassium channel